MAKRLDECRMVRYHAESGSLDATDLGRTASHYYLSVETIEAWGEPNPNPDPSPDPNPHPDPDPNPNLNPNPRPHPHPNPHPHLAP